MHALSRYLLSAVTSGMVSLAANAQQQQPPDFRFDRKVDLPVEFLDGSLDRARGDLDGDGLLDACFSDGRIIGALMTPGRYFIHETLPTRGTVIQDLAILENHANRSGGTLFTIESGQLLTYRYGLDPRPGIHCASEPAATNARSIATWSSDFPGTLIGFVALVDTTQIRVMTYLQSTGQYFADAYTITGIVASGAEFVDLEGDANPELLVMTPAGALLFSSTGQFRWYSAGGFSSAEDMFSLRGRSEVSPEREVLVWSNETGGQLNTWQLSLEGMTYSPVPGMAAGRVAPFERWIGSHDNLVALGDDGTWILGHWETGGVVWGDGTGVIQGGPEVAAPMVADFDGDGDSDLVTITQNEDPLDDGDPDNDGVDVRFWANTRIAADRRASRVDRVELSENLIGTPPSGDRGPSGSFVPLVGVKLLITPPQEVGDIEFTHLSVRVWNGAEGMDGVKELLVESEFGQAVQSFPAPVVWPATGLDFPIPGGTILLEATSTMFTDDGWSLPMSIPSEQLTYFEIRCVNDPGGEDESIHPPRFYVVYLEPPGGDDEETDTLLTTLLFWHGASMSAPLDDIDLDFRQDPIPHVFELTGVSLQICGYPIGPG